MISFIDEIKQLIGNTKGLFFILFFRTSNFFTQNLFLRIIGIPVRLLYTLIMQWILGIDIPDTTSIGKGFVVYHGQGLVIHKLTVIGNNVIVRHNTTIGIAKHGGGVPVIGDYVEIGANAVIIGEIIIGNNSIIAAGSVVLKSVAPFSVVAGNPAKLIRCLNK